MKEIAVIFLFFSFGVLSLFGQPVASGNQQSDERHPQSNFRHDKVANGTFLAQGLTAQEADLQTRNESRRPTREDSTEHAGAAPTSEAAPNTLSQQTEAPSETAAERGDQWEKTRRIFKIVNDYELAADEVLTSLVIIAGNARLEGRVTGNVLVLGGNVELASSAQVNGTLHLISGEVTGNIEKVANLQVSNRWQMIPAAVKLVMHPRALWEIRKEMDLRFMLVKFVLLLLMYLLVVTIFPRPINAVSEMLIYQPVGSILFSALMLVVIPLIVVLLTLSIIGVPLMLLGLSILLPLAICGKAAIFLTLGGTLFSGRLKPLAVIFGYILYFMATALPYIDWVTFLVVNTLGIGICLLSGINMMRPQDRRRNTSVLPGNEWSSRSERM
ncbi:polymer-forming cytoskeletal protein [Candidatus Poribacteria bacterium]|nr:polymer-forming cytoskeletal protein [Candidatus Poribacteria bacterium]MYK24122.1 polymer-forming cytoskeletal protein [Candidatus Poribacteria bacterium]